MVDEPALLAEIVKLVQSLTDVPLSIDSSVAEALASGLEAYKGKALVNSVTGEEERMETVFPLVKKHGAAVICLTMDDHGIPTDVPTRIGIAEKIINEAAKLNIPLEDIIIDPLAMSVAADDQAGLSSLEALSKIRDIFGVNQTIGASNVSYGLPDRTFVNCIFLAMAVINGLTCPITDPTIWRIKQALILSDMMLGKDEFSMNFITAYREQFPQED